MPFQIQSSFVSQTADIIVPRLRILINKEYKTPSTPVLCFKNKRLKYKHFPLGGGVLEWLSSLKVYDKMIFVNYSLSCTIFYTNTTICNIYSTKHRNFAIKCGIIFGAQKVKRHNTWPDVPLNSIIQKKKKMMVSPGGHILAAKTNNGIEAT